MVILFLLTFDRRDVTVLQAYKIATFIRFLLAFCLNNVVLSVQTVCNPNCFSLLCAQAAAGCIVVEPNPIAIDLHAASSFQRRWKEDAACNQR